MTIKKGGTVCGKAKIGKESGKGEIGAWYLYLKRPRKRRIHLKGSLLKRGGEKREGLLPGRTM